MNDIKRAVVFAGFSRNGLIFDDVYNYLQELKKYSQYIIAVYDNASLAQNAIERLNPLVNEYIIEQHGEYDFGSYKRGFFRLKENGILNSIDKLLFCNDSVIFQGNSFEFFFECEAKKDFYGLTKHLSGMYPCNTTRTEDFVWARLPHLQSFFLSMSKAIFSQDWFENFMKSIKKENHKYNVIAKYEIGISNLIKEKGFSLESFYPETGRESCRYFLSQISSFTIDEELYVDDFCVDNKYFLLEKRAYSNLFKQYQIK